MLEDEAKNFKYNEMNATDREILERMRTILVTNLQRTVFKDPYRNIPLNVNAIHRLNLTLAKVHLYG